MKPGGWALHVIPSKYRFLEGHLYVPLGSLICSRWWYRLWATLGIRNEFQKGLSAKETAERNAVYVASHIRYLGSSLYRALWNDIGYECRFVTDIFARHSSSKLMRTFGRVMPYFPPLRWYLEACNSRVVLLRKLDSVEDEKESEADSPPMMG